ncbi:alpha/beta fold hydrolase [Rhodoferax saidenbachensis]|uniref:Alpha/beta hydrolase n=1 Tax=Rhodoferax saidenbachensis TaxID=1484693 RepID=A0A1P8KCF1_9BURK|nr:alpha/beta hydrolase [Rhodoferax saidenbachensis]APW43707.1 alpha/beta hydrolase [Rhodoferax saidenbachensis]
MKIRANGIEIEVEDSAQTDASFASKPVVLLIMGLGMQLVAWPPQMVKALEDAGYRVVRFDNRDVGLSTHFDFLGRPKMLWSMIKFRLGLVPQAPYTLSDMCADTLGVLDALKIAKAHVVGVSMGGMIAQRVAIAAPSRTLSLTSIMSTSGARGLPQAKPEIMRALLSRPSDSSREAVLKHSVGLFKAIGSSAYPTPEAEMRTRVAASLERSFHPVGTLRQMLAIVADITRAAQLARITSPTLVIHGKADPLVPYPCGEDTAKRIPGAKLIGIDGMGHDLPPEPVRQILQALLPHFQAAASR